jgi:hypothetical protein
LQIYASCADTFEHTVQLWQWQYINLIIAHGNNAITADLIRVIVVPTARCSLHLLPAETEHNLATPRGCHKYL